MSSPPTWDQLRELMLGAKPPLVATVYAMGKDPAPVDLAAEDPGPAWAVAWVDPRGLATLPAASGRVTGIETEAGRERIVAEVSGIKGKAPVRVWVDAATGSIVRLERLDDPAPLVMVEGLREA